jgi:uncharacterized protein (DUF433 family)
MDWSGCELVELRSGDPVIGGTTISPDELVADLKARRELKRIEASYPGIPPKAVREVLSYAIERLAWDTKTLVDWRGCAWVEQVPGRCSGAPTVVGTRIFPDTIAEYLWSGASVDVIREDYPTLSRETILGLMEYIKEQELSAA